jgi:hypothetical protein
LDHSNLGLEIGFWAANVMSCNIKYVDTYPRVLTETEFQTETTL